MKIKKIFSIFTILPLILFFWLVNFSHAIFGTYFKPDFYNDDLVDAIYENSRSLIISEFDNQTSAIANMVISVEDFSEVLDKHYQKSDVEDLKKQFLDGILNYKTGDEFVISLKSLKSDLKATADDLSALAKNDFLSYYIKSMLNFYEYIPAEIDLTANNQGQLEMLNFLFTDQWIFQIVWFLTFALGFFVAVLLWGGKWSEKIKFSSISLFSIAVFNFLLSLGFNKAMERYFTEYFPIQKVNNISLNPGPEIYNIFISPLYPKLVSGVVLALISSVVIYLLSLYIKSQQTNDSV